MKKSLLFLFCLASYMLNAQSYNSCVDASNAAPVTVGTYSVGTINGDIPPSYCIGNGTNVTGGEWFKYTTTTNYEVTVSSDLVANGDKDTRVHVYKGNCGSLQCYAADDDSGVLTGSNTSSYLSIVTFNAYVGETYYIVWDDRYSTGENFIFTVSESHVKRSF